MLTSSRSLLWLAALALITACGAPARPAPAPASGPAATPPPVANSAPVEATAGSVSFGQFSAVAADGYLVEPVNDTVTAMSREKAYIFLSAAEARASEVGVDARCHAWLEAHMNGFLTGLLGEPSAVTVGERMAGLPERGGCVLMGEIAGGGAAMIGAVLAFGDEIAVGLCVSSGTDVAAGERDGTDCYTVLDSIRRSP